MSNGIDFGGRTGIYQEKTLAEKDWLTAMQKKHEIDQLRAEVRDLKTLRRRSSYGGEEVWGYIVEGSEMVSRKEATDLFIIIDKLNTFVAHQDWGAVRTMLKHPRRRIGLKEVVEGFRSRMKQVVEAFDKLKENFDDMTECLIRCAHLEKVLGNLERSLQKDGGAKYLRWTIADLRAVLNFNYPEDLKRSHLSLVDAAIKMVERKGMAVDRRDSRDIRRGLINSGLSLLPTSKRAIDEFGDGEPLDEQK